MWKVCYKGLGSLVCKEHLQINKSKQPKPKWAENMQKKVTEQEIFMAYENSERFRPKTHGQSSMLQLLTIFEKVIEN